MSKTNKLVLSTIICNLCILIGIGHSLGPIALFEPMFLTEIYTGETSFTLLGAYSERLPACAVLSMAGQFILIVTCFLKTPIKYYFIYAGLATLLFSLYVLSIGFSSGESDSLSLLFALPFLFASIRMIIFLFETKNDKAETVLNTRV